MFPPWLQGEGDRKQHHRDGVVHEALALEGEAKPGRRSQPA